MNVIDLMARLGGEILANKARAVVDGKIVVLARLIGEEWVYTDQGQDLANSQSNVAVAEAAEQKTQRTRKSKDIVSAAIAVESSDVESEL